MNIVTSFIGGLFFANGIPHFVNGISGRRFPTPFARPPGKGLSSSITNVVWGLLNFIAALASLKITEDFHPGWNPVFIAFTVGFVFASIVLSVWFKGAERDI